MYYWRQCTHAGRINDFGEHYFIVGQIAENNTCDFYSIEPKFVFLRHAGSEDRDEVIQRSILYTITYIMLGQFETNDGHDSCIASSVPTARNIIMHPKLERHWWKLSRTLFHHFRDISFATWLFNCLIRPKGLILTWTCLSDQIEGTLS